MLVVMLESPYAGDVEMNLLYARMCMKDSIKRGEAPFASHLLYTQDNILDDNIQQERDLGIKIGMEIASRCDATVVYTDLGVSKGMQYGIQNAIKAGRPVIYRELKENIKTPAIFWIEYGTGKNPRRNIL